MNLEFDLASCVRATSRVSECTKCVDICPTKTMEIVDNIPSLTPSDCVDCGGCVGVCPTEAFSLANFSSVELFFGLLESRDTLLSCKKNLPCIASLSVEHLLSLALASDEPIVLDLGHCSSCAIKEPLYGRIEEMIEEVDFVLSSLGDRRLETTDIGYINETQENEEMVSRRDIFSLKNIAKKKDSFDKEMVSDEQKIFSIDDSVISSIKNKKIPNKRKILFSTLKQTPKPPKYEVLPEADVSFISQKFVDESCTNCQICYRICPTGALSSDGKFSLINFDSMLCVKCHLCHDVCEPNAIGLQSGFEIRELFEPTKRTLATFSIKRCNECGGYFTYRGGEKICPRCKVEEDEAIELHHIAKGFNI